jgi:hypothetical protein
MFAFFLIEEFGNEQKQDCRGVKLGRKNDRAKHGNVQRL